MELKFIDKKRYDSYINKQFDVSFQMRSEMKSLFEANGWTCSYVGLEDGNEIVGAAILSGKKMKFAGMLYTCQYGPHMDYSNEAVVHQFFSQLPSVLKTLGASKFEFNPNLIWKQYNSATELINECEYPNLSLLENYGYKLQDIRNNTNGQWNMRFHCAKSLEGITSDELIKTYNSQAKRSVKKAIENGIVIEEVSVDKTDQIHNLMEMSAQKHGFSALNAQYYDRANKSFGEKVKFICAKLNVSEFVIDKQEEILLLEQKINKLIGTKKETMVGDLQRKVDRLKKDIEAIESSKDIVDGMILMSAGVFLSNDKEFIYLFGGNNEEYKQFCSSFALQDYAMKLAIQDGATVYNMYGIEGAFDGSDSILRFKSTFDCYINEFVGTYELVLNAKRLKIAQGLKKIIGR